MSASDSLTLAALAELVGATLRGDGAKVVTGIAPLKTAGPDDLTFLATDRFLNDLHASGAGAVLIHAAHAQGVSIPCLVTPNPRLALAKALDRMYPRTRPAPSIHDTAVVPASCIVGDDVFIGPYAVLGERVTVGNRCAIHAHAVVYDDVTLGDDCVVHANATVRERVTLGAHCIVHNGAIVGGEGFGFAPRADGSWHPIRHIGAVRLGDFCEIQSNACVDRGALNDTVLGAGTKVDNLAQVGHGNQIGNHVLLCGQVGLAGSCTIGDHAVLGGQVGVADHLSIAGGVRLAAQSGVIADIEEPGNYAAAPAVPFRRALHMHGTLQRLPEIAKSVRKLEERVEKLESDASTTNP